MADPVTLSALVTAAGTLVSGYSSMQQSSYQSSVAEANSKLARLNAKQELEMSGRDQEDLGAQNRGLLGEQVTAQAASGAALDSPSSSRARYRARDIAYEDIFRRAEAGNKTAANYRTQSNVFKTDAAASRKAGKLDMISAVIGAGSSLVGAAKGTEYRPTATKDVKPTYFSTGSKVEPSSLQQPQRFRPFGYGFR